MTDNPSPTYRTPTCLTCLTCLTSLTARIPCDVEDSEDQVQITYVTHLTENGADRRFIQEQVGHRCDTSTAIYTHVSGDFMNTALRKALSPALDGTTDLEG